MLGEITQSRRNSPCDSTINFNQLYEIMELNLNERGGTHPAYVTPNEFTQEDVWEQPQKFWKNSAKKRK